MLSITRQQIEGWKQNKGDMSPNEFRALCDLALQATRAEGGMMKEEDYIAASNLQRLRLALQVMREFLPQDKSETQRQNEIVGSLFALVNVYEKKV